MVERGAFNHAIMVLGVQGTGKSIWALHRAVELGRTPAYVIAHDLNVLPGRFPDDGRPTGVRHYDTIAGARAAMARDGRGVFALTVASGNEVLRFAREVAHASLARGGGARGVPVVLLADEGTALEGASANYMDPEMKEIYARRRHLLLGVILTCQSAMWIHPQLIRQATELVIFRLQDEAELRRLVGAGMPRALVDQVPRLPDRKCIVWRPGMTVENSPTRNRHSAR